MLECGVLRLKQTDTGELVIPPVLVDGEESVKAALWNIFSTQAQDEVQAGDDVVEVVTGEWPFKRSHGIKWRGAVLGKFFNDSETKGVIAMGANKVPEIQRVSPGQVSLDFDFEDRRVLITLTDVRLMTGETIASVELDVAV